jgi:hypothetical protein
MLNSSVRELLSQIDGAIIGAVRDVILSEEITFEKYLDLLDAEEAEFFEATNHVVIRFAGHRVYAKIPTEIPHPYSWELVKPRLNDFIEVEIEGVFENELKKD